LPDKSNLQLAPPWRRSLLPSLYGEACVAFTTMSIVNLSCPTKSMATYADANVGVHQTYLAIVIGRCAAMS
jgi:hypothetical protein